ncbi:MAG: 50S ribosomal protein L6 [Chloroflexi bacterium]|nr:50S ribosomal protein L6 [Chloroflexota bacterium]
MSRIGMRPIQIPKGVEVKIDGRKVTVKGSRGELTREFTPGISVESDGKLVIVKRSGDEDRDRALHGLSRSLLANMVAGVSQGFSKSLELVGTGYRVQPQGKNVALYVGFTHQVIIQPLATNALAADGQTRLVVSGPDKEMVGRQAAEIRMIRPPNSYTGKGIRFVGEVVKLKPGKSAAKGTAA